MRFHYFKRKALSTLSMVEILMNLKFEYEDEVVKLEIN